MVLVITKNDVFDFMDDTGIKTNGVIRTDILKGIYLDIITLIIGGRHPALLREWLYCRLEEFKGSVKHEISFSFPENEFISVRIFTDLSCNKCKQ